MNKIEMLKDSLASLNVHERLKAGFKDAVGNPKPHQWIPTDIPEKLAKGFLSRATKSGGQRY